MPARQRQWLAHRLIALLRPRLSPTAPLPSAGMRQPVVIVGFLSSTSGLGQAARLAADAFEQQGFDVFGIDLSGYFFEMSGNIRHDLRDGRGLRGPAHVIVNINAPYMPYVLWLLGRKFLREKHVTGYWAWELPSVPASWRRGGGCVHAIAVPSHFVADAVRWMGSDRHIVVAPHPISPGEHAELRCDPEPVSPGRPFTVLSVLNIASGFVRKNPVGLIRAFKLAFADDPACRLRLLVSNSDHYPSARASIEDEVAGAGNIEIAWDAMDRASFLRWWGSPDLYASLHRAEGFGLPLAEAMAAGYPVLATGWSGNLEFMDAENSFLVDYRLVDVTDAQLKYPGDLGQWAEPDVEHAASLMKAIKADPAGSRSRAARGREAVLARCNARTFCGFIQQSWLEAGADDNRSAAQDLHRGGSLL